MPKNQPAHQSKHITSDDALIDVQNLHVSFPRLTGTVDAVRGLSLTVRPGQLVALVGESGSGKSVTARTLVGLTGGKPNINSDVLRITGKDVSGLSEKQWREVRGKSIGFVLQDALVSLDPLRTIGKEVAEPILAHKLANKKAAQSQVYDLLASVGVPDPEVRAHQYSHELSGGLRQRALIASALAAGPQVIIADEPTTALDVTVQKQVMELLSELTQQGKGILLITHDLAVVSELADYIHVMRFGEVVESGAAREVLENPKHPYTRQLLSAVPSAETKGKQLYRPAGTPQTEPIFIAPPTTQNTVAPFVEVKGVTVNYTLPGGQSLLAADDVSFSVQRGSTLGIVGESGSGKSTVGKVLLGLQTPTAGEVFMNGEPWSQLTEAKRRPMRGKIQVISQDPLGSFNPQFTVEKLIAQPLRLHTTLNRKDVRAEIIRLMGLVGLPEVFLSRRPHEMSGGQRQRVAIARALASSPELLVCDEAVSALDVSTQAQVLDLLVELRNRLNLTVVFISHDIGVVHHMSDHVIVMKSGEIVEEGEIDEVFFTPRHEYTKKLLAAVPTLHHS